MLVEHLDCKEGWYLVIEINKDIECYRESVAMGFTAKQLGYSIASVIAGGGLVLLLYPYIGLTMSVYVAVPVAAPIALGGFYSCNGMGFYEVMERMFRILFFNRPLTYVSTEGEAVVLEYQQKEIEKNKKFRFFQNKSKQTFANNNEEIME